MVGKVELKKWKVVGSYDFKRQDLQCNLGKSFTFNRNITWTLFGHKIFKTDNLVAVLNTF